MKRVNDFIGAFVFICTAIKGVGQRFMQNCFSFYYSNKMLKNALDFVKIILKKNGNFVLALRKRLFCDAKQPLLPCKTYAFTMQNNRFCIALIMRVLCNRYLREKYLHLYELFFRLLFRYLMFHRLMIMSLFSPSTFFSMSSGRLQKKSIWVSSSSSFMFTT